MENVKMPNRHGRYVHLVACANSESFLYGN
jgi:hypothetical protein